MVARTVSRERVAAASNNEVIRDKSNDELLERLHT